MANIPSVIIGTTTGVSKAGQTILVQTKYGSIQAKAAQAIAGQDVVVFKTVDGKYLAYGSKTTGKQTISQKTAFYHKHAPKKSKSITYSVALIYRVKTAKQVIASCQTPRYDYNASARQCIEVCNGSYGSLQECKDANPNALPWYTVIYFNSGFLGHLNAPVFEHGFMWPLGTYQSNGLTFPRCGIGSLSTGIGGNSLGAVTGNPDNLYTASNPVLPHTIGEPYNFFLVDTNSENVSHAFYAPPEASSLLSNWERLYKVNYSYWNDPEFLGHMIPTGNEPWERQLNVLDDQGQKGYRRQYYQDNTGRFFLVPVLRSVTAPNFWWRRVDISRIGIYDHIYTRYRNSVQAERLMLYAFADLKANYDQPYSYELDRILYPTANYGGEYPDSQPPFSVIGVEYQGNSTPTPPVDAPGGGWTLLYDSRTCPSSFSPPPVYRVDEYTYYLVVDGVSRELITLRSDEPLEINLTNLGDRLVGSIKHGFKGVVPNIEWAKILSISSTGETTYSNSSAIPDDPADWRNFTTNKWPYVNNSSDPCISGEFQGNFDINNQYLFNYDANAGIDLSPSDRPGTDIVPLSEAIFRTSPQLNLSVLAYVPDFEQETCTYEPLKSLTVTIPQVNDNRWTNSTKADFQLSALSIWVYL